MTQTAAVTDPPTKFAYGDLVSLIIFGYNQAEIIRPIIMAALAQDYVNLEIVLSDNGSADETFAVMTEIADAYKGPHTIRLNRNEPPGRGFIGHVNQAFDLCRGALIVYNPGDDVSEPHRVARLSQAAAHTQALLIHSDVTECGPDGLSLDKVWSVQPNLEGKTSQDAALMFALCIGATCAWRHELMDRFGPIEEAGTYDDLVFYFRALLAGRVAHVPEPLMRYRTGIGLSHSAELGAGATRADRLAKLARILTLNLSTMRQRRRDADAVGVTDIVSLLDPEIESTAYQLRLIQEPGFDRAQRFSSWRGFRVARRMRRRLNKTLTHVT
ncbi:glycosyltransferase [uncultured Tateyamaria sp.]|uniref:glycosyltransferase n=1 Tax=uncultured Tateyamaria sp. TaxID=455651 RepID=UPI00260E2E85|nr:glycosyltransferase [uncultured Tateyamaria sp.]